jgi:hypothetical protein
VSLPQHEPRCRPGCEWKSECLRYTSPVIGPNGAASPVGDLSVHARWTTMGTFCPEFLADLPPVAKAAEKRKVHPPVRGIA